MPFGLSRQGIAVELRQFGMRAHMHVNGEKCVSVLQICRHPLWHEVVSSDRRKVPTNAGRSANRRVQPRPAQVDQCRERAIQQEDNAISQPTVGALETPGISEDLQCESGRRAHPQELKITPASLDLAVYFC